MRGLIKMKLFVATHNQHKIREISQILPGFEIVPDDPEGVEENAPDFAGNALIIQNSAFTKTSMICSSG